MNNKKRGNLLRSIAFFLTAVILICTFGFTVDGWTFAEEGENIITGNIPGDNKTEDSTNSSSENIGDDYVEDIPEKPEIYIPEYIDSLTGLETTEELSKKRALAFVINGDDALFGISGAKILCEVPTEDGNTRLIAFLRGTENLWKIGAISPLRGYIGNVVKYFGGIAISAGCDDYIGYASCDLGNDILDLAAKNGYHYTERQDRIFTNKDLLDAGISYAGINTELTEELTLPFFFTNFGEENKFGKISAKEITINQSRDTTSKLSYDENSKLYSLYKNGSNLVDTLNGKQLEFTNCFVLFADSVTYDKSEYSQTVVDTMGSGKGFYFTEGTAEEISWTATAAGFMTFYSSDGEKLTVNRGSSYICYMKASRTQDITFS